MARSAVKQTDIPLAEVLLQLQASGYHFPAAKPGEKWTPEKEHALASIITMDRVRRVWMGSIEITELIRRQLQPGKPSSLGVTQFGVASSPFGGISSITQPVQPVWRAGTQKRLLVHRQRRVDHLQRHQQCDA